MLKITPAKSTLTHFISIPLINDSFQKSFKEFKDVVLRDFQEDGISEGLFVPQARLHVTVGVLSLEEDSDVQKAVQFLESCKETVLKPVLDEKNLHLKMKGLGFFKGKNPNRANVLFSNVEHVDDPNLLQNLVNNLKNKFYDEGLLSEKTGDTVKIHATLMKTTRRTKFKCFNVENILKEYGDFSFGDGIVSRIDLSKFISPGPNDYYLSSGTISIP